MTDLLEPNRDQIERFIATLFARAGIDGYVSMRAFTHDSKPLFKKLWTVPLSGGLPHVFEQAYGVAHRVANNPEPGVFCPPPAVFNGTGEDYGRAREEDLLLGLVISVECDEHPEEARQRLQEILGEATMIVKSGGQWIDGNDEPEDKLHLYWRLAVPARGEDLKKLKRARDLATRIAGGDSSNKPIVHCLRAAGSWHRKAAPRLCIIAHENPDREIDLDEALRLLEAAAPPTGNGQTEDFIKGDHTWHDLMGGILQGKNLHNGLDVMAAKMVAAEHNPRGANINIVRTLMQFSPAKIDRPTEWQARYDDIPRDFKTAEAKFKKPQTGGLPFRLPIDIVPVHKPWLIKGVFACDEVSSTIGRPGGGKSALLVDKGVHLARGGHDWRGYKIKQRRGVIYFALERGKLIERRIQAYKLRGDLPDDAPFGVVSRVIDLLNQACVNDILDTIKAFEDRTQIETGLLIFDSYSKGIGAGGGDEDKAKDQNRVAANMRRVIEKKSVHIAGVGHTGKDESRGERGSNARLADVDVQETVNGNDKTIRTVTVTKANDQDEGLLTSFVLERITLGVDEDGEEEWTYIVDPQKVPEPGVTKKLGRPKGSAQAKVALSALELAMSELGCVPPPSNHIPSGVRTINLAVWKDYFLRHSVAGTEKTESRDKAFNRAVNSLQAGGLIGIWGDQVWLTGQ
jgi:hypothetical protein